MQLVWVITVERAISNFEYGCAYFIPAKGLWYARLPQNGFGAGYAWIGPDCQWICLDCESTGPDCKWIGPDFEWIDPDGKRVG